MKIKNYHLVLLLVALIVGFMFTFQLRITRNIEQNPSLAQAKTLVNQTNESRSQRDALKQKVSELRAELDKSATGAEVGALREELNRARMQAGMIELTGAGVEVTLSDSKILAKPGENPNLYVLHDEDVLKVINELKAAGAQALSINGQRLMAGSEIRCIGPTILTNKSYRLTPPFIISAVGDQNNMINSLQMRGGIVEQLQFWGIQISIKKVAQLTIPAFTGDIQFSYAKPVAGGKGD